MARSVITPQRAGCAFMLALVAALGITTLIAIAAAPARVDVEVTRFVFAPKEITVAPGTRVTWTNRDETPHTVSSQNKSFASKGLDTDDTFEHTFGSEGDFDYICTVHPYMTGVVHVRK